MPHHRSQRRFRSLCVLVFALASTWGLNASPARAQCDNTWIGLTPPLPPEEQYINTLIEWDPDGTGPARPVVVVGGKFYQFSGVVVQNIATWDGSAWSPLGPGLQGNTPAVAQVRALEVTANNDLIAGGSFRTSAQSGSSAVARWTGSQWVGVGTLSGVVYALAIMSNGDIVAGGLFTWANNFENVGNVARWNGSRWVALGGGVDGAVGALASLPNGDLIVGGNFTHAGGIECRRVARWDGAQWHPIGAGLGPGGIAQSGYSVNAIKVPPNGGLIAGGQFDQSPASGVGHVARWDGAAWSLVGSGLPAPVVDLAVAPDGDLYAGVIRSVNDRSSDGVFRWDGVRWTIVGGGMSFVGQSSWGWCVCGLAFTAEGDLLVGGAFTRAGGAATHNFAKFGSPCRCLADVDDDGDFANGGSRDGSVTIDDLLYALAGYEAGDASIDLDDGTNTGTSDGAVTIEDLLYYLARFEEGC